MCVCVLEFHPGSLASYLAYGGETRIGMGCQKDGGNYGLVMIMPLWLSLNGCDKMPAK